MYEVLVPVDTDANRARHQAAYVARLPNAGTDVAATVLYVVPPGEFTEAEEVSFADIDAAVEAADHLEEAGVEVTRVVDDGTVSEAILDAIDGRDADEVVMGGRNRSGVAQVLLGSTTLDVTLSTDRPVTLTGESASLGEGTRRVLVPVDPGEERARHQAAYVANLPGAPEGLEAAVLHVFPHQDYKGAPSHEFDEVDGAVEAAEQLEAAGIAVERVAVGGEVAREILEAATERDVDGIVLGGRKRSGVQKVILGSTVRDVMLSAERPVTVTG